MAAAIRTILADRDHYEAEGDMAAAAGTLSFDNPYNAALYPEQFSAWRDGWYGRAGCDRHPKIADVPGDRKHPLKAPAHPANPHR